MDTDGHGFDLAEGPLTHAIIGAAFEVLNSLGHGLHEKPYENAWVVEFDLRGLSFEQQRRYPVASKRVQVAEYVPDLLVGSAVVVDAKVGERITDHECGPMLNYLRSASLRVGLILNFQKPKLEGERVIL